MINEFPIFIRGKVTKMGDVAVISKGDSSSFTPGYTLPTSKMGRRASLAPLPTSVVRRLSMNEPRGPPSRGVARPNTAESGKFGQRGLAGFLEDSQKVFRWFVNGSLVYKISSSSQANLAATKDDQNSGNMDELAEYRRMTILFLKLKFPFNASKAQRCMEITLQSLKKYDGVMQQVKLA
jgi:hypothetical protein